MIGEYYLASSSGYEARFNSMVTDNEYSILINMLGADLYNTYAADIALEAWTKLLDGVSGYEDFADTIRNWQGLKNMLIPYHYSKWIITDQFNSSLTGFTFNEQEHSRLLTMPQITRLANKAFDEFLKRYNECFIYLYTNLETYTEFDHFFINYKTRSKIIKTSIL